MPQIERQLLIMRMLASYSSFSVEDIAEKTNYSISQIYRYIDFLYDTDGFEIEKIIPSVYHLESIPKELSEFNNLVYFTEEEAYIVHDFICSLNNNNALKAGLMKKLKLILQNTNLSDFNYRKNCASTISLLRKAISEKKKVILKHYSSGNSKTIRNRFIEPFEMTGNYSEFWAYDLEDNRNKTFKVERIHKVIVLDESWTQQRFHRSSQTDCFHMGGDQWTHIVVSLDTEAMNLIGEEYPLALEDITQEGKRWILDTYVKSMKGIGRFVLGVNDDVKVLEGEALKEYLVKSAGKIIKAYD